MKAVLKAERSINSADRSRVANTIKLTELTLEQRIRELVGGLGEQFAVWLLDGQVTEWAQVSAAVRNALSHGYPTRHRVEQDRGALLRVLRTMEAVIRLRLLVEAGLPPEDELLALVVRDRHYVGLVRQTVADWRALATAISGSA